MANCEDLITTDDLAAAKIYANKMTEFVESSNNTMTTPEGEDKLTITGMGDIAKETISLAVSSAGYTIVGDFSDSSKVTITSDNQVYTSKLITGSEDALWRTNQVLPYTPTGADPTSGAESGKWVVVAQGELKSIARSLNVLNTQAIYSTDTTTVLDDVLYIYDASEQITYAKPADVGISEVIVSVDSGVLTTDAGAYTLININSKTAVLNVQDFGIKTEINSSADFASLKSHIVNNNLKNVTLLFPDTLTSSNPSVYLELDGLDNFIVDGIDIIDTHDYESTGNFIFTRMFELTNTKNISITNAVAVSTLQSVQTDGEKKGFMFVRSVGGDTFKYTGSITKGYRPFEVWDTGIVTADSVTEDTRYSAVAQKGCGVIDFNIKSKGTRRNFYIYGGNSVTVNVDSIDQYGRSPLQLNVEGDDENAELSNVDIKFKERNTLTLSERAAPISLMLSTFNDAVGTAVARNINIEYDVVGAYGTVINLAKYYGDDGDTAARGYVIDGLNISGTFESTLTENMRLINWADNINWYAGDSISKVKFDNLTVNVASGYALVFNLDRIYGALTGSRSVIFDEVNIPQGFISSTDDYSDKVVFVKTNLRDYSGNQSGEGRKTLRRADWVKGTAGATGVVIKIAQVDNNRSYAFIDITMKAHGNPEALSSTWVGTFSGTVSYNASSSASVRITPNKLHENATGVLLNPILSANTSGEIFVELPEWNDTSSVTEAEVWLDFDLNYAQYTDIDNPYLVGLYSNKYELTFGAGY